MGELLEELKKTYKGRVGRFLAIYKEYPKTGKGYRITYEVVELIPENYDFESYWEVSRHGSEELLEVLDIGSAEVLYKRKEEGNDN